MQNDVMLGIAIFIAEMLGDIVQNVVMPSVIMLSVVAHFFN
jgi:hypothetical protein